jgi:hypothetical protein
VVNERPSRAAQVCRQEVDASSLSGFTLVGSWGWPQNSKSDLCAVRAQAFSKIDRILPNTPNRVGCHKDPETRATAQLGQGSASKRAFAKQITDEGLIVSLPQPGAAEQQ